MTRFLFSRMHSTSTQVNVATQLILVRTEKKGFNPLWAISIKTFLVEGMMAQPSVQFILRIFYKKQVIAIYLGDNQVGCHLPTQCDDSEQVCAKDKTVTLGNLWVQLLFMHGLEIKCYRISYCSCLLLFPAFMDLTKYWYYMNSIALLLD